MNVLLVSPSTPTTFWSFKHALPFVLKRAAFPPLGLLTVAAMLPKWWEFRLVDMDVEPLRDEHLSWAEYVLVSAMLVHERSVADIANRCRVAGKAIIAGGPLFTTGHERFPLIDHFVVGEAEDLIPELARDMEEGCVRRFYEAKARPDISKTPVPRWDLINTKHYVSISVQFCRGCPYDCEFCDIIVMNGRVPRTKPPERFISELEALRRLGWDDSVFLVDDNFIGNKKKVKELLRAIIAWQADTGSRMTFLTEASVNLADDRELLDLMARARFKKVFLGIETPETESLKECHKLQNTRRDLVESVRRIQRAGMQVMGGFIVGFDNDGPDIFEKQFQFIQRAGVVTAMVGVLTALPTTRLYSRLRAEGRLLAASTGNNTEATVNFVTKLDRDYLVNGYRDLMRMLYEPATYYRRIRTFLNVYGNRGARSPIGWDGLVAFLKSFWVLGLRCPGRWQYLRFLGHSLLRHPKSFGQAVALAIYGHHFRLVAKDL